MDLWLTQVLTIFIGPETPIEESMVLLGVRLLASHSRGNVVSDVVLVVRLGSSTALVEGAPSALGVHLLMSCVRMLSLGCLHVVLLLGPSDLVEDILVDMMHS